MDPCSWQHVLDTLTQHVHLSNELLSYKKTNSNVERIKLCHGNSSIDSSLEKWFSQVQKEDLHKKNEDLASILKKNGNEAYLKKKNIKAMEYYNKAILVCPESTISLLYGNRSAVLFEQKLWKDCTRDIDVAISCGFPVEKVWKLYRRKGEVMLKLHQVEDSKSCFKKAIDLLDGNTKLKRELEQVEKHLLAASNLEIDELISNKTTKINLKDDEVPYHGYNETVTSASKSLSFTKGKSQGRHFLANESIVEKSVVIIEKPYAFVLLPDWYNSHCQHCLVKVTIPYPCTQCTEIFYCSVDCQKKSWKSYHYLECGKLNIMAQIGVSHLALRIILISDISTLESFFENGKGKMINSDGFNSDGAYATNYRTVFHLMTHSENHQPEDIFQYTVAAFFLLKLLKKGEFFFFGTSEETKFEIGGLLLHHILQIICNAYAITSVESMSQISENMVEQEQVRIATAMYPTASIANHSCQPNIINTFDRDTLKVQVIKDIKKGEQIYNCYGPHYRRMGLTERQDVLKKQYFFECDCVVCVKGLKSMEEFDSYRCPKCSGNLCTASTICSNCETNVDINELLEKSTQADAIFQSTNDLLSNVMQEINKHKLQTALSKFVLCLSLQKDILCKFHSSLGKTYDAIAKCYALMYNYEESIPYLRKSIKIVVVHYGKTSREVMNEYIKLCDVYFALMQIVIDQGQYAGVQKYFYDALDTVDHCLHLQSLNRSMDCDIEDLRIKKESLSKLRYLRQNPNMR